MTRCYRQQTVPKGIVAMTERTEPSTFHYAQWLVSGTLFLLVGSSLLSCGCGGDGDEEKPVTATVSWEKDHESVLEQIEELGGVFGERSDPRKLRWAQLTLGHEWKGANQGVDILARVPSIHELELDSPHIDDGAVPRLLIISLSALSLKRSHISNSGISQLRRLPALHRVELDGSAYDNSTLATLSGLNLISLTVGPQCRVDDAGLAHLRRMDRLLYLAICTHDVTDVGLDTIGDLRNLRALSLAHTSVDDESLSRLSGAKSIEYLDLSASKVSGTGLPHLHKNARLHTLILDNTQMSDESLHYLTQLAGLQAVSLDRTAVTDFQLPLLRQLPALATVSFEGTSVTMPGLRVLVGLPRLKTARCGNGDVCIFSASWAKLRGQDLRSVVRGRLFVWSGESPILLE